MKSEREKIQDKITAFLVSNKRYFDAPYGVLTSLKTTTKGGKVRSISFGVSRILDAEILILTPNKIIVNGQGGLASSFNGTYSSVEQLLTHFRKEVHR